MSQAIGRFRSVVVVGGLLLLLTGSPKATVGLTARGQPTTEAAWGQSTAARQSSPSKSSQVSQAALPITFERHTGDLDEMVKRHNIRALVLYSRSGFFYVDGRPEGI